MQGLAADGVREGQGKSVQRLPVDQIGDDLLAALAARRAILGSGSAGARAVIVPITSGAHAAGHLALLAMQAAIGEGLAVALQMITENRIAEIGQMHADLVRASGFEL